MIKKVMRRGFSQDTPLTMYEIEALRTLEFHPEVVKDIEDWDNLCSVMELTVGSMISPTRHRLIARYTVILDVYNLL